VYLDYTGAGLYGDSQVAEHLELLRRGVFGNPHSLNPTSAAMTELVESARAAVLDYFHASAEEYVAVFTPNATGALHLIGEAYPFRAGDRFLLTFDNHNSVNGIREYARASGAETTYVPSVAPELRVDETLLHRYLDDVGGERHNLFAFPAQSNFSGVQHPLEWIEQARPSRILPGQGSSAGSFPCAARVRRRREAPHSRPRSACSRRADIWRPEAPSAARTRAAGPR
jgi:molybdenum cofactor sulfurtransferase